MRSIHQTCGALIAQATGEDDAASALLAAITANESAGCRRAYQFSPENYQRLIGLSRGEAPGFDSLTRPKLEKRLAAAKSEAERFALMKRLAGLHGYTHIPGYYSILWKLPVEALIEKESHFDLAVRRLKQICGEYRLDPSLHAVEIARRWNVGVVRGRTRPALYLWRLVERMKLYEEIESAGSRGRNLKDRREPSILRLRST